MKLAPVVVGENYRISVTLKNLRRERLDDLEALAHIWIRIGSQPTRFDTRLKVPQIRPLGEARVESDEQYLMRERGEGDIQIEGVWADNARTRLSMMYQGRSNQSFLASYEVEPRRALVERIVWILVGLGAISSFLTLLVVLR